MTVSGFTIIRNGEYYAYPFLEAIKSILPLCDEFIVNVGKSDDNTLALVKSINDKKIKILESEWDMSIREHGRVLSIETNKALKECKGDWCFYIQGDEVLHEKYFPEIKEKMNLYLHDDNIDALRFKYQHFYGSYNYVQDNYRNWYIRESRVIKNSNNIVSWGDAMDFKYKNGTNVKYKDIDAEIYHYGWVRPPETLIKKRIEFQKLWHNDEKVNELANSFTNYDDLGNLIKFTDTHPSVIKERINESNWDFDAKLDEQKPDWVRKILIFIQPLTKRLNPNKS